MIKSLVTTLPDSHGQCATMGLPSPAALYKKLNIEARVPAKVHERQPGSVV